MTRDEYTQTSNWHMPNQNWAFNELPDDSQDLNECLESLELSCECQEELQECK